MKQSHSSPGRIHRRLAIRFPHFKLEDLLRGIRPVNSGKGFTKAKFDAKRAKMRRKMAKASQRINRRRK
jgi:hypothetical protein